MKQLIAELDGLAEDMARDGATGVNTVASASQQLARLERENAALRRDVYQCPPTSENDYEGFKWRDACEELEREVAELRNEIARLNGQTVWVCACGGTDCAGQKENAALRADKERLDWLGSQKGQPWLCWDIPLRLTREVIDAERKEAQS